MGWGRAALACACVAAAVLLLCGGQINMAYIKVPYTIGDPLYLYVFTKKAHQVWTEIISQGGYPVGGYPNNFIVGYRPKARHFHAGEFWNGSIYMFGGIDKDMYFNDIWRYKLPTFSSDRSRWYELVVLWERDIPWLAFTNNRYNHEILKDVYEHVCKDVFDSFTHQARGDSWELGLESAATSAIGTYEKKPTASEPIISPIPGRNPVKKSVTNQGLPAQAWEPWGSTFGDKASYIETNKWVCEEIRMRYDFMQYKETFLTQDFTRPTGRYGAALKLIYTDINSDYKIGQCNYTHTGYWYKMYDDYTTMIKNGTWFDAAGERTNFPPQPYERGIAMPPNSTAQDDLNVPYHDMYEPRVTGIDRRVHWEVPKGCRPQLFMCCGYDVNDYYKNDLWFFDLWNHTWQQVIPIPHPNKYVFPPVPRKYPSVNVYRPGYKFKPGKTSGPPIAKDEFYTELIFVHGGWQAPPIGAFQDCHAYSREYNKWIDLKPLGRLPSARVFDEMQVIGTTGYLVGGVFGAFKIDVMKYNFILNRFSLLYAAGAKPSARSFFSTTIYRDSLYVFGGRGWVTVDNIDKQDMWQYNSTENFWYNREVTGVMIPARWGHSMNTFVHTLIVFGGVSTPTGPEMGVGDTNEIWRFDLIVGALLADSQFNTNVAGWSAYQNFVEGDAIIPTHCDDYASKFGDYWGSPCKVMFDRASKLFLWIDTLHNDTETPPRDKAGRITGRVVEPSPYLGANGIGYVAAPVNYVMAGNKMYQGRLRYQYMKVFPMEDDEMDRAFQDTKDDVLLVGESQVLAFDILDQLVPKVGTYTLVDVDLDEAKGWYVHGTNGTIVPTKDEFVNVLSTLKMILIRVDYFPGIYKKNISNYDDLGTVLDIEDAYRNTNDSIAGLDHNQEHKLGFNGSFLDYGERPDRVGYFPNWDSHEVDGRSGVWKYTYELEKLGRRQTHGEIIAMKTIELFENSDPLTQDFLNDKVEGRTICVDDPVTGQTCSRKTDAFDVVNESEPILLPEHNMVLPTHHSMPAEHGQ